MNNKTNNTMNTTDMDTKKVNMFDSQCMDIDTLETASQLFFQIFGSQKLLGEQFFIDLVSADLVFTDLGFANLDGEPKKKLFETLLIRCGYENNFPGFFQAVCLQISRWEKNEIIINNIRIPNLYLYRLLEILVPGNRLYSVKTIDQLEQIAWVRANDKLKLQEVIDQFPVRLSDHVIRQSMVSDGIAKQYLPFAEELDPTGHTITFDGHFKAGVLEQMYRNRVIFLLDMSCPVYCRFCFRKHKSTRKEKTPTPEDVLAAVDHVKNHSEIKEILITGGEPLLNKLNLETAINSLMTIDHVQTIRIATRSVAYYPELFLKNNKEYIRYLLDKNTQCMAHGKRIEIGLHFVHPDEVSIQCLDIISQFVKNGIQVYLQTPFLNGLNTDGKTLATLFTLLRQAGVKIYYIFTPCHTIHGTKEYWTPISQAFEALKYLRANVSDRCIPKLCTATSLGKIEWHTSGWAVETDKTDENYTWIRTPYTPAYFDAFVSDTASMPDFRVNDEGTLDAKFLLNMGDDRLIAGKRPCDKALSKTAEPDVTFEQIEDICSCLLTARPLPANGIDRTPSKLICRTHKTRVEMYPGSDADDSAFEYIQQNSDITDVVIHLQNDGSLSVEKSIKETGCVVNRLKTFAHIVCIRICCLQFNRQPQIFTTKLIDTISQWCDFSIADPVRIEIEAWFMLPQEIGGLHGKIAKKLIQKGVNIYANVPLIRGVNDRPEILETLAHKLRHAAIEFHHMYVAGLGIQKQFNAGHRVDAQQVIDIASRIRKECSGRQIPLYMVQTPLGDVDFDFRDFISEL
ncbi:radical SAM protein [Desulfobacula toluolica]|uniref:Radical SAM domain protein, related to lysine 2,3-aminomutase n=1 Tax=Desulfobacula toluolica (strain DSM 7467 / Tol2) TaxID=651182 RepID=K0NT70_DESTT|nr:radical SAM protein [Desulfobacula toluolica]CCK82247.1 radical SAM domain protein, related to lysine 2,3-aminomutase [Desulfobacula toluolica Tol2]